MDALRIEGARKRFGATAALEGLTISELLLREIRAMLAKPTRQEILARLTEYPRVDVPAGKVAELIREARDSE